MSISVVHCGAPPPIDNGYLESSGITYDSEALYRCDNGFNLNTSTPATCNRDGEWVGVPVCVRKSSFMSFIKENKD